eukprot:CAMPEP_0173200152 /NCGR_PEP_ID=MMETSP1141-20130122/17637_1 /TAXON_ID=483371 /ORGANISM="non described non described, Strain CCMP2298" /LENGTH=50 /DNA_ID=CAMNT_0014125131 /DNA_START=449 /DNA_END=601 /DNA_ORIENTATION=+
MSLAPQYPVVPLEPEDMVSHQFWVQVVQSLGLVDEGRQMRELEHDIVLVV